MFIKLTPKKNGRTSVRIVESYWEHKKSRQRTLISLGSAKTNTELQALKKTAQEMIIKLNNERKPALPGMAEVIYGPRLSPRKTSLKTPRKLNPNPPLLTDTLEETRIIQGIGGVCGAVYEQMGFDAIIQETYKDRQWNEYLKACVLSRVAEPCSKRKTVRTLEMDYNQKIPLEKMYRMMDRLYVNIGRVKSIVAENTLSLFKQEVDILFFDVTTLYFESFTEDELRRFGFSKDCKFKETQVVLALVTNFQGHPLSYELFPGNTSEGKTLISAVERLKRHFTVRRSVLVADRAMFTEKNLEFMDKAGVEYIVAAKLKSFSKLKKEEILAQKPVLEKSSKENSFKIMEHNQRRLIVNYSAKRAAKDKADRQRLIERLMKKVSGKEIPLKELISNYGTKKYITVQKTKATLNEEKIKEDSRWDGLYGVVTNVNQSPQKILSRYRGLWRIEEAFRVNKHTLKMRPIYHWTRRRIEAHIAICFLAYSLSYMLKYRLECAGLKFSIEKIRDTLKRDQYSVIEDQRTGKRYRYPSKFTEPIRTIYEALGLKRVSEITSLS